MAKSYTLAADGLVNGDQLVAEVQAAHGIDISNKYGFVPPKTIEIADFDEVDFSATIAAHDPEVIASTDGRYSFKADGVDTLTLQWNKRSATAEPAVVIGGIPGKAAAFTPSPNVGLGRVVVGPTTTPGNIEVKVGNTRVIVTATAP